MLHQWCLSSPSNVHAIYGDIYHIRIVTCDAGVSWNGKYDRVRESRTLAADPLFQRTWNFVVSPSTPRNFRKYETRTTTATTATFAPAKLLNNAKWWASTFAFLIRLDGITCMVLNCQDRLTFLCGHPVPKQSWQGLRCCTIQSCNGFFFFLLPLAFVWV